MSRQESTPFRAQSQRHDPDPQTNKQTRNVGPSFRTPARPDSGDRQFASTPRFVFTQPRTSSTASKNKSKQDEIEGDDLDGLSSPPIPARDQVDSRSGASSIPKLQRKEAIEDSDDENLSDFTHPRADGIGSRRDPRASRDIRSTESPENEIFKNISELYDDIFPPTPGRSKRRRLSSKVGDTVDQTRQQEVTGDESIKSLSSSEPSSPSGIRETHAAEISSSPPPGIFKQDGSLRTHETPVPRRRISGSRSETPKVPSSESNKTPFQSHPKFVLSTSGSTPRFRDELGPSSSTKDHPPVTPPHRRKPNFVLPRQPSPDEDRALGFVSPPPAPFSPPSHTLRQRGRPRAATSNYKPGGNADEVRNWILEMAAKREQFQLKQRNNRDSSVTGRSKYAFTARVEDFTHGMLTSGPMILVRVIVADSFDDNALVFSTTTATAPIERFQASQERKLLLIGQPTSHSSPASRPLSSGADNGFNLNLQRGDVIGVHPGLMWEIELSHQGITNSQQEKSNVAVELDAAVDSDPDHERPQKDKWLVAAEWDVIKGTQGQNTM